MAEDVPFPYLRWAKENLRGGARISLGLSGRAPPGPDEWPAGGLPGPLAVGDAAADLRRALAARYEHPPEGIHLTAGASHANFLCYLAFARGGHVAAETPTYEALHCLAGAVGATLATFRRDPKRDWRVDRAQLERAAPPGTRLIAVTDPHNPSGVRLDPDDLDHLAALAERRGAVLLVDEVYADLDPAPRPPAARRHALTLTTNSLTKAHGLGDLRAGWVLGSPAAVRTLDLTDDWVHPVQPALSLRAAAQWLAHCEAPLARTRALAAERAAQVERWIAGRKDVWWRKPDAGLTGFVRLGTATRPLDGQVVARRLFERHQVRAVPGAFFQAPEWLRLSFGLAEAAELDDALGCLGEVLDGASR